MTRPETAAPIGLVTWFHADDLAHAGWYPQIRGSSSSSATYEVYLRCVDVCVASFRRWNPHNPCLVVLNPLAETIVSVERRDRWRRLGVEVRVVENRHLPARELFTAWQNQFFLFDVLRAALQVGDDPAQPIIVVDSDVVVRGSLSRLGEEIARLGRVSMRVPYGEDEVANGASRRDLAGYVRALRGTPPDFVPVYQGGEFVGGTRSALAGVVDACEAVYAWTLEQRERGEAHPNEEAHILSVADPMPESAVTGNAWIERIWTKPWNLRRIPDAVGSMPMWHLPAEKRTGIPRLHAAALESRSWFWGAPAEVWNERAGRILGVPRYGAAKLLQDLVALRGDVAPALVGRIRRLERLRR
ncbi:MAG: hypothetical protein M3N46_07940 [Actinomycetota bacterium]|nr:hypothetical protein [Actinomycetota bacterium]